MARVRKVEISNFRGIKSLTWLPTPGVNCLIGPGDSGKSTIIDAIEFCLGSRRSLQFTDADFHGLDVESPIVISLTLGELDDSLKSLDSYGMYLRGFFPQTGVVEDEPEDEAETVVTLRLIVEGDLEPNWILFSERSEAQGMSRSLSWSDRGRLAPTRIGVMADYHLGWGRGSVLNRVSEERPDASAALAEVGRQARAAFGEGAQTQLEETLEIVAETARKLGIAIGDSPKAMLDAHSVSLSGGTITLHDEDGVPLRGLGTGSTRLLIAGLQRRAAAESSIILIDELELGLEPHRIIRLIDSLGAKEEPAPLQVFLTTHSPVAVCELSGEQLFVVRQGDPAHQLFQIGNSGHVQGTVRRHPEALLAHSILACEGASEVGFIRGVDRYRSTGLSAIGVVPIDCQGVDQVCGRARALRSLGYRVAIFRDSDKEPPPQDEKAFTDAGGIVFAWPNSRALEDELFCSLTSPAVAALVRRACTLLGDGLVNDHIKSHSQNAVDLAAALAEADSGTISSATRTALGKAAKSKTSPWFKTVSEMEDLAYDIVSPDLSEANDTLREQIDAILNWASHTGD